MTSYTAERAKSIIGENVVRVTNNSNVQDYYELPGDLTIDKVEDRIADKKRLTAIDESVLTMLRRECDEEQTQQLVATGWPGMGNPRTVGYPERCAIALRIRTEVLRQERLKASDEKEAASGDLTLSGDEAAAVLTARRDKQLAQDLTEPFDSEDDL